MNWISQYLPTVLICLGLTVIVTAIIVGMIRDKKKGKTSCGGCGSCPMSGSCHHKK